MVEDATDDRAVTLQVLNDLHPLQQLLATGLQLADLLDPGIQDGDLLAHEVVARLLVLDGVVQVLVAQEHRSGTQRQHSPHGHQEALLALLAQLLAPR
ncbi:hypothetical protein D3C84_441230 [compost metagenome]